MDLPEWSAEDHRCARKLVRRYILTGVPWSHNWMCEVRVAPLAIALSLVAFFERLGQ